MKYLPFILFFTLTLFAQPTVTQLFSVQKVSVKKQSISQEFKTYGYVKENEQNTYAVTPRFSGFVEKIYADKIYQKVYAGMPLVRVYSPEVYKAKEDYLNSYLYQGKSKANKMVASAKQKLELLGVAQNEINTITKTKKASPYTTIYAPIKGIIFTKSIMAGAAFNQKQNLYTIVDLSSVWVEAKLFANQIEKLKTIQNFTLTDGINTYHATNSFLYPKLNEKEATYTLRIKVHNTKAQLLIGSYVDISALTKPKEFLTLPKTAVIQKGDKHYVFLSTKFQGEYEPVEVEILPLNHNTYAITKGLKENEEVINNALFMMDSDAQINGLY